MNKKYDELYEVLINSISRQLKKTLFEYEEFEYKHNDDEFIVKIYDKKNYEDKEYISKNKRLIWDFFDKGYKAVGLNGFSNSCFNYKSLSNNFSKIKLAYNKENILIAASVYSNYNGGNKCVGITAITDDNYREIGKTAVKYIIQQDIGLYNIDFYWGTFDGIIEHYYERFGGILIPNNYAYLFDPKYKIDPKSDSRIIFTLQDGTEVSKVIYGFNSKETYDKIINNDDERIKKEIDHLKSLLKENKNKLNESNNKIIEVTLTEPEYHVNVINLFYDERLYGRTTLTPYMVSLINISKNYLTKYIKENPNIEKHDYYELAIVNAEDILDTSMITELHKF